MKLLLSLGKFCLDVVSWVLPSFLVLVVLTRPAVMLNRGVPIIQHADHTMIHELFPNSTWGDLEPCGSLFNEAEEFAKAQQCVDEKVWPKTPLKPIFEPSSYMGCVMAMYSLSNYRHQYLV